jgi:hypothetical protein
MDSRHDGSRGPILIGGIGAEAEPRPSVDPGFLQRMGPSLRPIRFRAAAIGSPPGDRLPDKVTFLYLRDHEFRQVRMNRPHPAEVTPSWYGDSVGYYEGDTLVIDTVGVKTDRPLAMLDMYGTPYTRALHVVERYRLLDYEAAREGLERDAKESPVIPNTSMQRDPAYRGKYLQLLFTVEDQGVFTVPWSATITYGRCLRRRHGKLALRPARGRRVPDREQAGFETGSGAVQGASSAE